MAGNLSKLSELANIAKGGKQVLKLACDEVEPRKQVREKIHNIESLARTIQKRGQIQPIVVSPKNADGKYIIQKGERRWRACKMLGLPVEAIINDKPEDGVTALITQVLENDAREDLEPIERAKAYQSMLDMNMSQADIAEEFGRSLAYVSSHLGLLKLPDHVQALYDSEVTKEPETLNCLRLLSELEPELAEQVCAEALTNGITRQRSRDLLRDAKQRNKGKAAKQLQPDQTPNGEITNTEVAAKHPVELPTTNELPDNTGGPQERAVAVSQATTEAGQQHRTSYKSSNEDSPLTQNNKKNSNSWREVDPGKVKFKASFRLNKEDTDYHLGVVMTSRIDDDAEYLWLCVANGDWVRVQAGLVTILAVEVEAE